MRRPRPPLRLLRPANPLVRLVLRSRAHRLLDRNLMLLTYVGRAGRTYTIPVMYARADGGGVVALAVAPETKRWWRAFRSGGRATLLIAGVSSGATGRLLDGEEACDALRLYLRRFPRAARSLGVQGAPTPVELDAAGKRVALVRFEVAGAC
jgi:hypothetical protein